MSSGGEDKSENISEWREAVRSCRCMVRSSFFFVFRISYWVLADAAYVMGQKMGPDGANS